MRHTKLSGLENQHTVNSTCKLEVVYFRFYILVHSIKEHTSYDNTEYDSVML